MKNGIPEKLIEQIKQIGLGDKEATVFTVLLNLGGAYPSKVAEEAKLNRSTTYKILLNLSVKGLVSELRKKNKLYYQVEKPEKLLRFAKNQIQVSEDRYEKTIKLLPELEGLFQVTPNKPRVRFFEGVEGILEIYRDHIDVKAPYEMLAFSNVAEVIKFLPPKFREEYIGIKNKIGIPSRAIVPNKKADLEFNKAVYPNVKKEIVPQLRYIPSEIFPFESEITLYGGNKVSIQNFSKEDSVGVIIEDSTIFNMMRMVFELSWAGAQALYPTKK